MRLPNMKAPCQDCLFRKDSGHVLIHGDKNAFVILARRLRIALNLSGAEKVFANKAACIEHHKN